MIAESIPLLDGEHEARVYFRMIERGAQRRAQAIEKCPRPESNQRTRFRKPLLYPLSYGGKTPLCRDFLPRGISVILSTGWSVRYDESSPAGLS